MEGVGRGEGKGDTFHWNTLGVIVVVVLFSRTLKAVPGVDYGTDSVSGTLLT